MLELKLVEEDDFISTIENLDTFNIVSENEYSEKLKIRFSERILKDSKNIVITESDPSEILQNYIYKKDGIIVAKKGKKYFRNKPLFLISIPKAGTHLLFELAKAFGYKMGGICPTNPKGGYWYYTEYSNSHTSAKHFFNDTVYKSDFGNRDHPFITSPALFIYRNPLDIVSSEANYYHKDGKTSFSGYLNSLNYDERLSKLIDDKWLLGSIRDRISKFIAWNYFNNVISISFEELIGNKGNGDNKSQELLIWSLQLKLQIPGTPKIFTTKIFNKNSDTFFKGQINSYKGLFKEQHYKIFEKLNQDFINELGYDLNSTNKFSSKIELFLTKKLTYNADIRFPPILKRNNVNGFNIVKYNNRFYAIPIRLGSVDIECDVLDESIIENNDLDLLINTVLMG